MQLSRLYYLWKQYRSGAINKKERHELMEMISASSNEEAVKVFIAREIERLERSGMETGHPLDDEKAKEIFTRIIRSGAEAPVIPFVRPKHRWIRRAAAAAAVLLVIGGGSYVWLHTTRKGNTNPAVASLFKNDVAPGGNKAVLTLANGSTILLGKANKGQLAMQGNSRIMKKDTGLLIYQAESSDVRSLSKGKRKAEGGRPAAESAPVFNTLRTPRGGEYQLVLPDGSKAWLNAASSIRFPAAFTGKERKVEITGEVYFEIAKMVGMPFIVKKGSTEVQVLGTNFDVNAYDDEKNMKITLLAGSVKVIQSATGNTQLLKPGQQAQINEAGEIKLIRHADINRAVAWKEGRFEFHGNIEGIMRQVARWYNVDVEYRGNVVKNAYGGAISRYSNVSKVLQMLELTGTIHFEIEKSAGTGKAGKIIVTD